MPLRRLLPAALILLACAAPGQDAEWVRTWTEAQRYRPAKPSSVARIAPANEPGTPLVIHGRIYDGDGKTPVPDVVVFAYHTDAKGLYHPSGGSGWRLRGWAKSDAGGRFELHTIRPASYPGTRNPAHVHLTIDGPQLARRWTPELQFLDDPYVNRARKPGGEFDPVRPVSLTNGTQHVDFNVRIADEGRF